MEEALVKRVLPHSIEAEQSVIGSMLMDRDAIIAASEIVVADDFYQKQYGIMFDTMVELFNEGKPVDLVTLQDRLKEKDVPPEVCSLDFVRDILATVPTSVNVRSYATIVHEKAVLRRLIRINEEIANNCYAGKDSLETILADTEKQIFNLPGCVKCSRQDRAGNPVKIHGNGPSDRIYRSGLPDVRTSAVGPDPDRGPTVYG